jgi:hypothetical protein
MPLPSLHQRAWFPVAAFTVAYTALAAIAASSRGNAEFLLYIAVMLVLGVGVLVVHARVDLGVGLLWALSLWGLLHMAGGLVPVPADWPIAGNVRVLYSWWLVPGRLKYDQVVHAYGFSVTTCACWRCLRAALAGRGAASLRPTAGLLLLCAAAAMGFGALNEVVEFAATRLVPETNVGGYENTGWDLVANMTGALAAAAGIWLRTRWSASRSV